MRSKSQGRGGHGRGGLGASWVEMPTPPLLPRRSHISCQIRQLGFGLFECLPAFEAATQSTEIDPKLPVCSQPDTCDYSFYLETAGPKKKCSLKWVGLSKKSP